MSELDLASNPDTPPHLLEELSKTTSHKILSLLASNSSTPISVLSSLYEINSLKLFISGNPKTPIFLLEELISCNYEHNYAIQIKIAQNPNTPEYLLNHLSLHKENSVVAEVAGNPNTPSELLFELSKSNSRQVREKAFQNPSIPPEALRQYIKSDHYIFDSDFCGIATNPSTPPDVLHILSQTDNKWVKIAVANNPNTSIETLAFLLTDTEPYIVQLSLANIKNNDYNKCFEIENITDQQTLTYLSKNDDYDIKWMVAQNNYTPPEILTELSQYNNSYVKRCVTANKSTPIEILEKLYLQDKLDSLVGRGLSQNVNTPDFILNDLFEALSVLNDNLISSNLSNNISTPNQILNQLTTSVFSYISQQAKQTLELKNYNHKTYCELCLYDQH